MFTILGGGDGFFSVEQGLLYLEVGWMFSVEQGLLYLEMVFTVEQGLLWG